MSEFKPIETQEQLDALLTPRLQRERETVEKRYEGYLSPEDVTKKYEGFLSPEEAKRKYEEAYKGYLSPEEAAKKDAKIKSYETDSAKTRIAHEIGIPYELAGRLSGEDEKAIRADAEKLLKIMGGVDTQVPPLGSTEPAGTDPKEAAYKAMVSNLTEGE